MAVQGGFVSAGGGVDLDDLFPGRSFHFDGINEYVGLGNISELDFDRTDPFSVSMWFQIVTPAPLGTMIFLSKQLNIAPFTGWNVFMNSAGQLFFQLAAAVGNLISIGSVAVFTFHKLWWHFAVTYDGSSTAAGAIMYLSYH